MAVVIDFNAGRKRLRGHQDKAWCPRCGLYRRFCACYLGDDYTSA